MIFKKRIFFLVVASVASPPVEWDVLPASAADHAPPEGPTCELAALEIGVSGRVSAVSLEDDLRRWLAAIGIARGDRVTVLRRAPFGGPIHLRAHTGGEFAVDRGLAQRIRVELA